MLATAVGCCELGRAGDSRGGTPSQSRGQRPYVLLQSVLNLLPLQVMVGAASTLRREWDHSRPPNIDKAPVTPQESVSLPPSLPTLAQGPLGALRVCQAATESPVELINVHLFIH